MFGKNPGGGIWNLVKQPTFSFSFYPYSRCDFPTNPPQRHGRALQFLSPQLRGDKEADFDRVGVGRLQEMGGHFDTPMGFSKYLLKDKDGCFQKA